jgi:pilus assembly protein CpaE
VEGRTGAVTDLPTGSVVAIFSAKGGVGRTTLAASLALGLAAAGSARVTLVDADVAFGDVAMAFDLHPTRNILAALDEHVLADDDQIRAQLVEGPEDLSILPAPPTSWPGPDVNPAQLTQLLQRLAGLNQFVVVDTPRAPREVSAAVLDAAEIALLVATPEVPVLYHSRRLLASLAELTFPIDRIQVVLNRAGSRTGVTTAEAQDALGHQLDWQIRNDHAAMQAVALGSPVIVSQPRSRVAKDIEKIVAHFAGVSPPRSRLGWPFWRNSGFWRSG